MIARARENEKNGAGKSRLILYFTGQRRREREREREMKNDVSQEFREIVSSEGERDRGRQQFPVITANPHFIGPPKRRSSVFPTRRAPAQDIEVAQLQ